MDYWLLRNFMFDNVTNFTDMFETIGTNNGVPANCEIIVKSQTEKDWFVTNFSSYTNIKTITEYEAEQNS